ncbi:MULTISPECIES: hypothetical protein [unclassified Yoonia]|uniref:hypothetical protein n=1 Tax=unclassified Yoonia TaxID=2629118 RepID=UPI002B001D3E|nr:MULTISPECIES: hypothetical protein [unclassified Yoonia]
MFRQSIQSVAFGAALTLSLSGAAFAQTAPNVLVTNSIDLTYNSGADTPTVTQDDAASVAFRVDRKIDVLVTADADNGSVSVVPGQETVVLSFLVENNGNDTQGLIVDVATDGSVGADDLTYSPTVTDAEGSYYVMISDTTSVDDGVVYNVDTSLNAGDIAAGDDYYVLVVANVPIDAADAQFADFVVTALATNANSNTPVVQDRNQGLAGVNTVFADAASLSTRTGNQINAAFNGSDSDETRILLTAPVIAATKTAVVLHEGLPGTTFACATGGAVPSSPLAAIPGACIQYTITVTNNSDSGTAATDIVITDELPDEISYAGVTVGDFTTVTESGGTITATLANLPADEDASFTIRAIVD